MAGRSFPSGAGFCAWLERHHATANEAVVEFFKQDSGRGGITYAEALDAALCYGWIDGVRKSLDASRYTIRFSPRRPRSIWSNVNLKHVERLRGEGRMQPAGLKAWSERAAERTGIHTFERRAEAFPPELDAFWRGHAAARRFCEAQPPGYRRTVIGWVTGAKREATRQRRFTQVLTQSDLGRRIDFLARPKG